MEGLVQALNTHKPDVDDKHAIESLTYEFLDSMRFPFFLDLNDKVDVERLYNDWLKEHTTMSREAFVNIFLSLKQEKSEKQKQKVLRLLRNREEPHSRITGQMYKLLEILGLEDEYDAENETEKMVQDLFTNEHDKTFLVTRLKEVYDHLYNQEKAVSDFFG